MPSTSQIHEFLDFVPAQLYEGKRWYIGYWVKNPITGQLARKQINFNRIKSIAERRKAARQICFTINQKLASGWNPFIEDEAPRAYTPLAEAVNAFISQQQKALKDDAIRPDTLRSYTSYCANLLQWFTKTHQGQCYTLHFTTVALRQFLDHIYYDRDNSPRTHNNYLNFLHTLSQWFAQRDYIRTNPTTGIATKREGEKKRQTIPAPTLQNINSHLKQTNPGYYALCQTVFYCFVRRTEAVKLKVANLSLANQQLTIPAQISKNRKTQSVTLPATLCTILAGHLSKATQTDYLFSTNNYLPGKTQLAPKKISDEWATLRKTLKLPATYQFYSLKDTGITTMLAANIPAIVVRDQARHHDISQTDQYTAQNTHLTHSHLANL